MKEIDALRAEVAEIRRIKQGCDSFGRCVACENYERSIKTLGSEIEQKLQQWWAQGCKELPLDNPDADVL
jgi:hypothetical protein